MLPITFCDMFCGIGGFRLGFERTATKLQVPIKCVFSSEIEKNAVKIYEKNFKETPEGDITKIHATDIPDIDILCGGFPCQDVSIAGKRAGLKGKRTGLFFDVIRIIQEKQPGIVFLENVKGLLNSNGGWDFARVLIELEDVGYSVEWDILNSKDFGVPQNRERVFIIGHLRGRCTGKIFPISRNYGEAIIGTLKCSQGQARSTSSSYVAEVQRDLISPVLTPDRIEKRQNGRRFKNPGEPMFTLTAQDRHGVLIQRRIRKLTPVECERLQGYPDGWTAGVSDSARYRCLGNAVTVNVIEAISEKLLPCLGAV